MLSSARALFRSGRSIHTVSSDNPSEIIRKKIGRLNEMRKKKKNPKKDEFMVPVPEGLAFLDTPTLPMILSAVAIGLFVKLLMMYDDSTSQERLERKIKNAPAGQGTVRMLTREEWDEIQEVRPRTPFESKFSRANARIRTDEPLRMEDIRDWSIDMITDALTRVEECVKTRK